MKTPSQPLLAPQPPVKNINEETALLQRREFIKNTLAFSTTLALSGLPLSAQAEQLQLFFKFQYRRVLPELFQRPPQLDSHYPVVIIGSGFGGAVSALRLGEAGIKTAVIERGNRWPIDPKRYIFAHDMFPDGRSFWHRTSTAFPALTFDLPFFQSISPRKINKFCGVIDIINRPGENYTTGSDLLLGTGVGGGSLVYTAVTVKPKREYWEQIYPEGLSYDEMNDVYYPRVQDVLQASEMPSDIYHSSAFKHSRDWDDEAINAGFTPYKVAGNWHWDIVRGEYTEQYTPSATRGLTNFGNSNGVKNDLSQNYIPMAEKTGNVSIHHNHEVKNIRFENGVYTLEVVEYDPFGHVIHTTHLTTDKLIMAAGSYHTTRLLVRAKGRGDLPQLNQYVGKNWGDNGNRMAFRQPKITLPTGGPQGAPSASAIYSNDPSHSPIFAENWANAAVVEVGVSMLLSVTFDMDNRGHIYYDNSKDDGVLYYPKSKELDATNAARSINDQMASANNQKVGAPGFNDVIFTGAHPVGGMELDKATDLFGRVHGYDGLYVMDGALIPGNTGGANPSFTIAALAERNIEHIIQYDF
ncbi:GMC oxidoreductase [Shewanella sp. YLB-07]|uniref:GMC oxidoreductase n=1 Tax=Shewanella sp. YLB-07 TaxID=2601268 RepID=UPI00128D6DD6|nr:GMC oxidoreductase [Shewanella sp. YLB-07]MPY22380.1 GMC family oxidoreductase [Shewanella sp. YLB-07]